MSTDDTDQKDEHAAPKDSEKDSEKNEAQQGGDEGGDSERYESGQLKDKPEPTDEQLSDAKEMAESYQEDRPTTVLPGSDGTVTGTAVNDWIDDEGKPVHGDVDDNTKEAAERDREKNERAQSQRDDSEKKAESKSDKSDSEAKSDESEVEAQSKQDS